MSVVAALHFKITIGANFSESITWRDSAGVLVPLLGGTVVEAKVRSFVTSPDVIISFTSDSPGPTQGLITITNPGIITLSLEPEQTALLFTIDNAVIDIKYTMPDGTVHVKLDDGKGLVEINQPVTRP